MPDITFTRTVQKIDPTTGRPTVTKTTIPGKGVIVRGDPKRYESLELRQSQAPTLKWAPAVYGQTPDPEPGDTTRFSGQTWTVKDVDPINPDGAALVFASIIVVGGG